MRGELLEQLEGRAIDATFAILYRVKRVAY